MRSISSIMKEEHDNSYLVVDALEKNALELKAMAPLDVDLYFKIIEFQRNYADALHHAKEEDVLFPFLQKYEETANHPEIKLLSHQHILSRAFIENMEKALAENNYRTIWTNALEYCAMIKEHIEREDARLFPLVEEILPEELKDKIIAEFDSCDIKFTKEAIDKNIALITEIRSTVGL